MIGETSFIAEMSEASAGFSETRDHKGSIDSLQTLISFKFVYSKR